MGISLSRLVKQINYMDFKLVAGEKGMSNEVGWVHMVENDILCDFLQGQELVFITGLALDEKLTLKNLIEKIYKKNVSGVVINTGPYISKVEDDIIEFGDNHNLPIFVTPWETRLADIMHIFSFAINKSDQEKMEIAIAIDNAFNFPEIRERYVPFFNTKGFLTEDSYAVGIVQVVKKDINIPTIRYNRLSSEIDTYLQYQNYDKVLCVALEKCIVIIFSGMICEKKKSIMKEAIIHINNRLKEDEIIYSTIGKTEASLLELSSSFNYAKKIFNLIGNNDIEKLKLLDKHMLVSFDDIGIYKILLSLEKKDVMSEYVKDILTPIIEYDRINNANLIDILKLYLLYNGSLKEVSKETFLHRNTVNYKLKKIEDILNVNLSNLNVRLELMIALKMMNLT